MGRLKGICISEKRGTEKHEVREAMVKMDWGIEGDAHGGKWHRQISLLSDEKIQEFRAKGAEVAYGAFGENLIVEGFDFRALPVGTRFHIGDVVVCCLFFISFSHAIRTSKEKRIVSFYCCILLLDIFQLTAFSLIFTKSA